MDLLLIYLLLIVLGLIIGWLSTTGMKSQFVRILDIILFGPILIFAATQVKDWWLKVILILMGASTMSYNLRNFLMQM